MPEKVLEQLVHMVAENNRIVKELQAELREFKEEMYAFRDDTHRRFDRLERDNRVSAADMDLLHR